LIRIGQEVPDFQLDALVAGETRKLRISDFRGKWLVLIFYPADFTFICPTELAEAADHHEDFKAAGAEIASVSADTVWTHLAWQEASPSIAKVKFPMLADPAGKLCRAFGTYDEDEGVSLRGSFIIDANGILKSYELHDNSIGRSSAEILRKLRAAVYVSEADGEVCPASWQPGELTLRPGAELVGKI
jgi:NADH-dependent peroxiredoxin subunit C